MQTTRIWLASIILLTVIAFLVVFKPLTFTPRKDPIDSSKFLLPAGMTQADLSLAPQPSFVVPNTQLGMYFYKPQHDLALDLDLRGGMRVTLLIPDRADIRYPLTPKLADKETAMKKQAELSKALEDPSVLGEAAKDPKKVLRLTVSPEEAHVVIQVDNQVEAQNLLTQVTQAATKIFGDGKFEAPEIGAAYKPVDVALQNTIRGIMEKRLDATGTAEVRSYEEGKNRVVLEIPGVKDPDKVKELLRTTAQMEFRLVPKNIIVNNDEAGKITATDNAGKELAEDEVIALSSVELTGDDLQPKCDVTSDGASGKPAIAFQLIPEAARKFEVLTATNVGRQLAIVLDKRIQMAPSIKDKIGGGRGIITGDYTFEEAKTWADLLNAGAMPVPVQIMETRLMSATLGEDSVSLSLMAGFVGLGLVLLFMGFYYRLPGIMANIALVIYLFLTLAVLKVTEVVLSLPGIAGIIISLGMAVDANVIIFERLKEELQAKKPLDTAIDVAFARAWTAILDSNVASIITGLVLYGFGSGAVRGFAVTLLIGVVLSMFTAVTITRLFMKLMIRTKAGHKMSWYGV